MFTLPDLPFDPTGFSGFISEETFSYHHGKHHAGYVTKLNAATENCECKEKVLEEIIAKSRENKPAVFNNAAQHFNHSFFWNCLSESAQEIPESLKEMIMRDFESVENFKELFANAAATVFGSGWTWLVLKDENLEILKTSNAETPIGTGAKPLLVIDVWEHAYYLDHKNARPAFIAKFLEHINWEFVASQI
jgi:superoxide dismutase, Fe-Mn family